MSSTYCKCGYMIWDKHTGLSKNTISKYLNDDQHITICGKCKDKVIKYYSDFDKRFGLNRPQEEIDANWDKIRAKIRKDLNLKEPKPEPEIEYVKEVKETKVCKICKEPTRKITDYGLCKKCDDWILHTARSKAGRKDMREAIERTEKVNKFLQEPLWQEKKK